eukprot:5618846-Prymnesium_polylepis.1
MRYVNVCGWALRRDESCVCETQARGASGLIESETLLSGSVLWPCVDRRPRRPHRTHQGPGMGPGAHATSLVNRWRGGWRAHDT